MTQKRNRLSLLALEQRWVFDGAAPVDVLQREVPIFERSTTVATPALTEGQRQAQALIGQ